MKRNLILSLVLCLSVTLGACTNSGDQKGATAQPTSQTTSTGGGDAQTEPSTDPITFTMFIAGPGQSSPKDNKVVNMIQEKTGVTLEYEFLVGDLEQKMGVMIASGDYPDIIGPGQGRARFLTAGAFVELDDLLPQYDNLWNHYEPYVDKLKNASPDKKIYLMDIWGRNYWYDEDYTQYLAEHNGPAFWVQKDVLAQSGYPMPKTVDEFFEILEEYYQNNPDIDGQPTLPFEVLSYDWRSFCLKNAPQHLIGAPNDGDVYVDKETFVAECYQNKDYAKAYYQKLNDMFKKGLISAETFTQNYDQYLSKISAGRVLAMFDQQWNFQDGENVLISEGKYERTYVPLGLTYEGYEQWYREEPSFVGGNGMGISVKCKDVNRALEYMNQLLDEELQKLMTWGIEGEDYYLDDNSRMRRTPEQKANYDNPDWKLANAGAVIRDQFPKLEGQYSDGNAVGSKEQPEEKLENQFPYDKEFFLKYDFSSKSDFLTVPGPSPDYYPAWAFTLEDGTDAKIAIDEVTDAQNKYLPRVIMADDFDAAWDEYMVAFEKINYKAYEDEINRQIKERMGS